LDIIFLEIIMTGQRIKGERVMINHQAVATFFDQRGARFNTDQPYTSVLYQDKNPNLAIQRDIYEKQHILPHLHLTGAQHMLDIGCGIGRWADAVLDDVASYVGIDMSESLIAAAKARHPDPKAHFHVLSAVNIDALIGFYPPFDRVLISGLMLYLNDDEVVTFLQALKPLLAASCQIYIREPLAIEERLTLLNVWSEELEQHYSAIYRSADEMQDVLESGLSATKFTFHGWQALYQDKALSNRTETQQFFQFVDTP
jgi:SAM-dependent methyltransferase